MNLQGKTIIVVHGLAAKPPEDVWLRLTKTCLIENIIIDDPELAAALAGAPHLFRSGYWADAVPHHVADDEDYCGKLKARVHDVIEERKSAKDRFHVGQGRSFGAFFRDKGLDVANVFMNALTIK